VLQTGTHRAVWAAVRAQAPCVNHIMNPRTSLTLLVPRPPLYSQAPPGFVGSQAGLVVPEAVDLKRGFDDAQHKTPVAAGQLADLRDGQPVRGKRPNRTADESFGGETFTSSGPSEPSAVHRPPPYGSLSLQYPVSFHGHSITPLRLCQPGSFHISPQRPLLSRGRRESRRFSAVSARTAVKYTLPTDATPHR
jgi:hypothetical protein